jgi:hypothetical protein
MMVLAEMHRAAPPPSPREYVPDLPEALEQIVLKVLSKEPSARYRTADQLGRVLTTLLEQSGGLSENALLVVSQAAAEAEAVPAPSTAAPFRRIDYVAVVLGLLAFLAVGGLIPLWLWACLLYPTCPILTP